MPLAMPTGSAAPMRPICVFATCVARLRIHGCARCATRRVHWGPHHEGMGGAPGHRISRPAHWRHLRALLI